MTPTPDPVRQAFEAWAEERGFSGIEHLEFPLGDMLDAWRASRREALLEAAERIEHLRDEYLSQAMPVKDVANAIRALAEPGEG